MNGSDITSGSAWLSYHAFFKQNRLRVLKKFILPLIQSLIIAEEIDRFFFIHYPEGGLHVRLRLFPNSGCRDAVAGRVFAMVEGLAEAEGDPWLDVMEVPFEPEVERYGGSELLAHSLEFFCISSVVALEFACSQGGQPRTAQLSRAFRLLGYQALGSASCAEEFLELAGYMAFRWEDQDLSEFATRGDQFFERRREDLCSAMEALPGPSFKSFPRLPLDVGCEISYAHAASILSLVMGGAGDRVRRSIGVSQMHMTANRLALDNHEEVYLARLLWRSATELSRSNPKFWSDLKNLYRSREPLREGDVVPWREVRRQYIDRLSRLGSAQYGEESGSVGRGP